jgi:hypothetical protein
VVELDPRFHSGKTDTEDKSGLEWRIRGTGPPDVLASCEFKGSHWLSLRRRDAQGARRVKAGQKPKSILIRRDHEDEDIQAYLRKNVWRQKGAMVGFPTAAQSRSAQPSRVHEPMDEGRARDRQWDRFPAKDPRGPHWTGPVRAFGLVQ